MPGEGSRAPHGMLFPDELPEFRLHVPEVLRQPLEEGVATITCAAISEAFSACLILTGAMNPCPCGQRDRPEKPRTCTPVEAQKC